MGAVAKDEHALAGQIGAVDRAGPPGQTQAALVGADGQAGQAGYFGKEIVCGTDADRHGLGEGLLEVRLQPAGCGFGVFRVHQHVEMGSAEAGDVGGTGPHRRDDIDGHAHRGQQTGQFGDVVAVAKAQGGRADQVGRDLFGAGTGFGQMADDLQEGFIGAKAFLALIGRQVERDDWQAQIHAARQTGRVVLDQFGRAGRTDDQRLGLETGDGIGAGGLEQRGGVAAQIAGLKGGIGDRRAVVAAFDHGEQKVGIGVALRGVQHVVQTLHRGRHAHRADMRWAFIGPESQLHSAASSAGARGASRARRRKGRANRAARSAACS